MKLRKSLIVLLAPIVGLGCTKTLAANALTVTIDCQPPNPGIYTLGWGTSRLVIPESGAAYTTFRMQTSEVTGTLCLAGDNSGVVNFSPDGKVWAYVLAND